LVKETMGLIRVELVLTNLLTGARVTVSDALVDSGATFLYMPKGLALQLGFDPDRAPPGLIETADGNIQSAPWLRPLGVAFANRECTTDAFVTGNEVLLGAIPMQAMDVIIDMRGEKLIPNPAHPNRPVFSAK
jgi:predicted aspartyl protease